MKILYFFLVYKHAELIEKTIQKLRRGSGKNDTFLFHIDKNSTENFNHLLRYPNVMFTKKRFETTWGSPELAFAVLSGLEETINYIDFDYVVLLSESDYPVKSSDHIHRYLEVSQKNHILTNPLPSNNPLSIPNCHWEEGGRRRIECYALRLRPKQIATIEPRKIDIKNIKQFLKVIIFNPTKLKKALDILINAPERSHPKDLIPCGGHQWFILKKDAIIRILEYIRKNKSYLQYCKDTLVLDEIFFATLVYNLVQHKDIDSDVLRFINWGGGNSPMILSDKDFPTLRKCILKDNILFVRKIDSIDIANSIDTLIIDT